MVKCTNLIEMSFCEQTRAKSRHHVLGESDHWRHLANSTKWSMGAIESGQSSKMADGLDMPFGWSFVWVRLNTQNTSHKIRCIVI